MVHTVAAMMGGKWLERCKVVLLIFRVKSCWAMCFQNFLGSRNNVLNYVGLDTSYYQHFFCTRWEKKGVKLLKTRMYLNPPYRFALPSAIDIMTWACKLIFFCVSLSGSPNPALTADAIKLYLPTAHAPTIFWCESHISLQSSVWFILILLNSEATRM